MVRIMTWNCLGMDAPLKRQLLLNYVTTNNIDFVFLQEGSSTYTNAVTEANSQGSILFPDADCAPPSKDKQVVNLAFANDSMFGPSVSGAGGVSRAAYYNAVGTPAVSVGAHARTRLLKRIPHQPK
jgi:hypothetical protein